MLANRFAVVLAATLFAAATYLNASIDNRTAPTTLVLSQPEQSLETVASLDKAPRL
jgi:hypothetical protein